MRPNADRTLDPIDLDRMPSLEGLGLDYRTDPERLDSPRSSVSAQLLQTVVLAILGAISLRLVSHFVRADVALAFACLAGVLLAAHSYAGGSVLGSSSSTHRSAAKFLLLGPAAWLAIATITNTKFVVPAYFITALAALGLFFLARRISLHFVHWILANPELEGGTRTAAVELWGGKAAPTGTSSPHLQSIASGISLYRRGLFVIGVAVATGFVAVLLSIASGYGIFAGMFGSLALLGALVLLTWRRSRELGLRKSILRTWDALANYLTYNEHETKAPGVFQSPVGRAGFRSATLTAALSFLVIVVVPSSSYFPIVPLLTGPAPWADVYQASNQDDFPAPEIPTRNEVLRSLTTQERIIYEHKANTEEKNDYLDELARRRTLRQYSKDARLAQSLAVIEMAKQPEGWVTLAARGAFQARWLFLWAFTASILLSVAIPPLILFFAVASIAGPLFASFHEEFEEKNPRQSAAPEDPHAASNRSLWDSYVERLQGSDRKTLSADDSSTRFLRDHLWLGTAFHGDYPVLLHREILHEHAWFLGNSGSGKTSLGLAPLMAQLIRLTPKLYAEEILRGHRLRSSIPPTTLILDFKGEPYLFHSVRHEAERAGIPFKWFTNVRGKSTYAFNPFLQPAMEKVTPEQKADILLRSLGLEYGEGYGPAHYSTQHANVLNIALEQNPEIRSFVDLQEALQAEGKTKVGPKQRQDAGDLFTLINSLAKQAALNVVPGDPRSDALLRHGINLSEVLDKPHVVYCYLPATLEEANVRRIGRLLLYSLLVSAESYELEHGHPPRVYAFIDEFQQIASKNLELFLRVARSKGLAMILSNQTTSDLKIHNDDLAPTVRGNTRLKQYFAASDLNLAKELVEGSGEGFFSLESFTESDTGQSFTTREDNRPRLSKNDILDMTNHPTRSLVDIPRGSGYSQFSGRPFLLDSMYHISLEEKERREEESWPDDQEHTLTVGEAPAKEPRSRKPSAPRQTNNRAYENGLKGYQARKKGDET